MPRKAVKPLVKVVSIVNPRGLHARAAAKFVKLANCFKAEIVVSHNDLTVNARSIMGLLMLGAGQGSSITISASGVGAKAVLEAIGALIADGFGEL
jgi:phosphocarrier protein